MNPIPLPPAEYLREMFFYDEFTGKLHWKRRPRSSFATDKACNAWNGRFAGKSAGYLFRTQDGKWYIRVRLLDKLFHASRIIWKMQTGEDPINEIDHKDGNGDNNIWANIRSASDSEQSANRKIQSNNTTGYKGVKKNGSGYMARIHFKGIETYLGTYTTAEEAYKVYCEEAKKIHGEFFNPG